MTDVIGVSLKGVLVSSGAGLVLALATTAASSTSTRMSGRCSLAQTWNAGNVYDWEELQLRRHGGGYWVSGDRKGTQAKAAFRYTTDGDVMTVTPEDRSGRHSVRFVVDETDQGCVLQFSEPPLPRSRVIEFFGATSPGPDVLAMPIK